ncbi:LAMI_0C04544g1_1 [Lachancea mirantina]|uniref:Large ribosomal subunit protein mL38 n=1 Tax=Lachancea mirantina TaxID=1230905 RepID=A0A1G4J2K2_9SACH|nr:LAMI_0C04544g1_1 [Lachancea mirantina]
MLRRTLHTGRISKNTTKIWSDFGQRPESLSILSPAVKRCVLQGTPGSGPPSIKRRFNRVKYRSPEKIDQVFKTCYEFMESRAAKKYEQLAQETDAEQREKLATDAELNNPEVMYNFEFSDKRENNPRLIDYEQPVYRHLGRRHWESYGQMLLMQRLETLAVIPDTLPTLEPRAEISVRFPFSTGVNKWIEPGELLSSNVTWLPPVIKIQEFDQVDPNSQLYTVLVVNPDEPDLTSDSFHTVLHYGVANVKISYNDNVVDSRKFDSNSLLAEYLAPVPEKNAGVQRFAVWVFRQQGALEFKEPLQRIGFNIREFSRRNGLLPVGAHIWRSQWDSNVPAVREKYALPPGRVFHRVRRPSHL